MQATVFSFDPESRSGTAVRDDGTTVAFDAEAFDASGLRLVRPGQRVVLRTSRNGDVKALTIVTLPLDDVCDDNAEGDRA